MDDGNRLTVYELVERVIPCIIAKHYSENYIQGFRSTFRNLLAYCNKNEKKYFTAELAQQFMLDCYGVQPGTVERRCSRVHRAMDLLSDYQHFNAVMLRRRLNREFPAGLQEGAVNYLQKLSLHGRRENTLRSHRNVLLRFTDYLFSVGVTDYKLLSADIVNRYVKVVSCNYSNSVVRLHYSILLRFFQYLAHSGYKETDLSLKMMPIVKVSASARIPTTLDLSQIESIYGAKGDKERLVGISDSMLTYMKSYRSNPLVANAKSIYFFPAPDGGFYDTSTIYDIFRKCLFDAGIPHRGRGKGPRLHDLRHSFAVHILNKWSSEGKDIYTCLPILRTALGHDRITTTEKYLRLVPEAYMEVTEPFNERFHTITEVLCNEE